MINSSKKVCAVVVTYNRRVLLKRCLDGVLKQDYAISQIIVVDNNSNDDSQEYINRTLGKALLSVGVNLIWKRLSANIGGAGGFSKGVEEFLKHDFDYVWLMDDDGYPEAACLRHLISAADTNSYIGPVVLSDKDKSSLSFPVRLPSSFKTIDSLESLNKQAKELKGVVLPFNGTLISAEVVKKIGVPDSKYFIWGDEVDYTGRAQNAGAYISTICDAFYYHPKEANVGKPMFFGLLRFNDPNSELKLYCYCRNNFVNKKKYCGLPHAILFAGKAVWYFCFTMPSLTKLRIVLEAFYNGINNNFDNHAKYFQK